MKLDNYLYKDYLGSVVAVTNDAGAVVARQSFDAWGRQTNPQNGSYTFTPHSLKWLRGYTSHEHLDKFDLINMNNRLYDPKLARMLAVDNYVQDATYTQAFNRYSYAWNNPLTYTDPDGDLIGTAIIIGAAFGVYSGIKYGKSQGLSGNDLVAYGFVGGIIGGFAGLAGGVISSAGGIMANTAGIMVSSGVNSVGQFGMTGGQSDLTLSAGAVSYNFSEKEFGYMGKSGNSRAQNWGYLMGALANLSDILKGFNTANYGEYDLVTEHSDAVGHSEIVDKNNNSIISVGPDLKNSPKGDSWHWRNGTNNWPSHANDKIIWKNTIKLNTNRVDKYANWLNKRARDGKLIYSVELNSCVTNTSRALNMSGVFNIGIHPYSLNFQMYLRNVGVRPLLYSYFLTQ